LQRLPDPVEQFLSVFAGDLRRGGRDRFRVAGE